MRWRAATSRAPSRNSAINMTPAPIRLWCCPISPSSSISSDEIDELGEIGQHHNRIGAGVILIAEFLEGALDVAARQRIEQIDHAGAVGKSQHLPDLLGLHGTR